jgi:hypothetical protein
MNLDFHDSKRGHVWIVLRRQMFLQMSTTRDKHNLARPFDNLPHVSFSDILDPNLDQHTVANGAGFIALRFISEFPK